MRVEHRGEHLQQGLLDHPVQRRRHPEGPRPAAVLGDVHPANGRGSVRARVEHRPDGGPGPGEVGPELGDGHAVCPRCSPVALDTSERPLHVLGRERGLPQGGGNGRDEGLLVGRRGRAPLWRGPRRLHRRPPPPGPPLRWVGCGLPSHEPWPLALGFAFGPSRRVEVPPVLRPLLTPGRIRRPVTGTVAGSACSPVPAPQQVSPDKSVGLPRTTAALTPTVPWQLGLRLALQARPDDLASVRGSCSSARGFASGFLPTPPHDDAVAFSYRVHAAFPLGDSHPLVHAHAGRTTVRSLPPFGGTPSKIRAASRPRPNRQRAESVGSRCTAS